MKLKNINPYIVFIYLIFVILFTVLYRDPVIASASYVFSFMLSIFLKGKKALRFNLIIIAAAAVYTIIYSLYNHFGDNVIFYMHNGNAVTKEAFISGLLISITALAVIMWFSSAHVLLKSDGLSYIFSVFSPSVAIFLTMLFRIIPRFNSIYKETYDARKCMGKGRNIKNIISVFSISITRFSESLFISYDSCKSRGVSSAKRSSYKIYDFDLFTRLMLIITVLITALIFVFKSVDIYLFYCTFFIYSFLPSALILIDEFADIKIKKEINHEKNY